MKTLFVAAILAMFMATTGSALAGWHWPPKPDPVPVYSLPNLVRCLPNEPKEVRLARTVTLQTEEGDLVRYTIDSEWARYSGAPNLSRYFRKEFNPHVIYGIEMDCEEDQGVPCTYISSEILLPGLTTGENVGSSPDRDYVPE